MRAKRSSRPRGWRRTHGTSFGAPTELEVRLAERICEAVPSIEQVRLTSSGTEATMSAIRLARGFTNRDLIVKFDGCYHGHSDALLATRPGSGAATFGIPGSPGVTEGAARDTLGIPFNDSAALRGIFDSRGEEIAAVIVEPVAANMGVVPPVEGFLEEIRATCDQYGSLLVFDEVITGFRIAFGGAQSVYGVRPDLTTLGKVLGGGFPLAAFGGSARVMEQIAPVGPIYQAGTLSGNPVAVAAGLAALDLAQRLDPYGQLEATALEISRGIEKAFAANGAKVTVNRAGSLFSVFLEAQGPVRNFDDAAAADHKLYAEFFHHMLGKEFGCRRRASRCGPCRPRTGPARWRGSSMLRPPSRSLARSLARPLARSLALPLARSLARHPTRALARARFRPRRRGRDRGARSTRSIVSSTATQNVPITSSSPL